MKFTLQIFILASSWLLAEQDHYDDLGVTTAVGKRQGAAWIDQPYSVASISASDTELRLTRNVVDTLKSSPGVTIQKTATGHGSPFIRGFTGYRTLALVDGVRYNNSVYRDGPNEYFSLIDIGALERLELIQGPSSIVYGNDAIGGTLNLHTKPTKYDLREGFYHSSSVRYQFSSADRSHQQRLSYELGVGGDWGLRLSLAAKQFGDVQSPKIGRQVNTGYDERAFDLRFDKSINDLWTLTAVNQQLSQDDVWRTHSTVYARSFTGASVGTDLRRLKDQRRSLSYINLTGELDRAWADELKCTFSYQTWDENGDRIRSNRKRSIDYFDSRMWGIDFQLEKQFDQVNLVYGLDFYRDQVDSGRVDISADGNTLVQSLQGPIGDDARYDQLGLYLKGRWEVTERATLSLGSRYASISARIGVYEDPVTGVAARFSDDWHALVNSFRISYALNDANSSKIWAGISQSFRAPNIADLSRYGGSRSNEIEIAATDLDAENFLSYEMGFKAETQRYKASINYFYTDIKDYITSTPTGSLREGLVEVSKQNSATGYVHGIELAGRYEINDTLTAWGNITWVYGELDSFIQSGATEKRGEPLSRIAPPTCNAGLKWHRPESKWTVALDTQLALKADKLSSGDRSDTQRIPPGGTPSYFKMDVYAGYQWSDDLQITLGVSNVFNEAYRVHGSGNDEQGIGMNFGMKASF